MATRPFSYGGEFVTYAEDKNPPLWVMKEGVTYLVTAIASHRVFVSDHWVRLDTLHDEYCFLDGSPCGVEEDG